MREECHFIRKPEVTEVIRWKEDCKDWFLTSFFFDIVMDTLTDRVRQQSMMFVDDTVICNES